MTPDDLASGHRPEVSRPLTDESIAAIRERDAELDLDAIYMPECPLVEEEYGPTILDEPGMCECGSNMDAHAGGWCLLAHDMFILAAERARIRAEVLGLPIVDVLGGVEWRKAILALLDGGEAKKEGWTEPPMTWQDRLDARKDYLDQYGVASEYDPDLDGGGK